MEHRAYHGNYIREAAKKIFFNDPTTKKGGGERTDH